MHIHTYLKILIIFLFAFGTFNLYAQQGKITGKILSKEENSPLQSATVVLHKQKDSSIVGGAISDKTGAFTISVAEGTYYVEIKFLGYEPKIIPDIKITKSNQNIALGEIKLEMQDILQDGITVEGEKEAVVIGIDSKTFNIDKDFTAGGNNVLDVLRKIPSVSVDLDDNITMNGSSPKILIDGRESNFTSKEMLKVLSSDLVEAVELITNPSAKYESEGVSGIIDIKLKKEIDNGLNGMINLYGGGDFEMIYNKNAGGGFYGNYKLNKFNVFGNVNYSNWNGYGDSRSERTTWVNNDTAYTNRSGDYRYNGHWLGGKIGADYNFNKTDVITLSANIGTYSNDNSNFQAYNVKNNLLELTNVYNYSNFGNSSNIDGNVALYYKKGFAEKGHNIYIDMYASRGRDKGDDGIINDHSNNPYDDDDDYIDRINSIDKGNDWREVVQVDYERTLKLLGNLGAGLKGVFRQLDDASNQFRFNYAQDIFELDEPLSDYYDFSDNIVSAYFTLGKKFDHFSYRLGLRAEYTDWKFNSGFTDSTYTDNYLSIIPSASVKYSIGIAHTFSASYSRRLQRPWYSQFDPYYNLLDSNSIYTGNPNLKPSYYNSFSVDYMLFTPKTTVTTAFYYRNTDNASQNYYRITDWGGIWSMPMNIAQNSSYGISISFMQTLASWWNFNAYFSLSSNSYHAPEIEIDKQQTRWSANFNNSIKIIDGLRWQISGYYSPASISLQGSNSAYYSVNSGFNYSFFEDKFSVNLNFNNLIFPNTNESQTFGDTFSSYSYSNWQHRTFNLGLSYKINDYKEKRDRLDEGGGTPSTGGGGGIGI